MHSRKFLLGVLVLMVVIFYAGCAHRTSHLAGSYLSPVAEINPEYEVLSDVTGTGVATYVGLYPLLVSFMSTSDGRDMIFGFNTYKHAKKLAYSQALAQNPNADTIVIYRLEEEKKGFLWWYKQSTVTVKAKAVKIK